MKPQLLLDYLHAEVFDRTPGPVQVTVSVKVELHKAEERRAEFKYAIVISSRLGQISARGTLVLCAESDRDAEELRRLAENKDNPPPQVVQMIVLNTEPLLLYIEKEMGLPIVPFIIAQQPKSQPTVPLHQ